MKHEYTFEELAELKRIYDESGEAGLELDEMRALRKAGLLTQGLPAKPEAPSKRDLILAHCKKRIDQGQTFDGKETAEALGMSQENSRQHSQPAPQGRPIAGLRQAFTTQNHHKRKEEGDHRDRRIETSRQQGGTNEPDNHRQQ